MFASRVVAAAVAIELVLVAFAAATEPLVVAFAAVTEPLAVVFAAVAGLALVVVFGVAAISVALVVVWLPLVVSVTGRVVAPAFAFPDCPWRMGYWSLWAKLVGN